MADVSLESTISRFRCRKCRITLFSSKHLYSHASIDENDTTLKLNDDQSLDHDEVDISSFEKCSSWFLRDESELSWVTENIEEAKWTEGKIYCPKCKSRIGAFDYIHGVHCNCGKFTIPSIWIQKCRVDHISPQSRLKTLDVRKPKSLVFLATNSSCDNGSNQMGDDGADISCHQNVASQHAVEENKYQGVSLHSYQEFQDLKYCFDTSACVEGYEKTIVDSKQTFEGWLTDAIDNRDLRSDQADECNDLPIREDNARHSEENLLANWSKRKRTKNQLFRSRRCGEGEVRMNVQTLSISEDKNAKKGMVDTIKIKVDLPEIQDRHCCSICLDLFFEPLKCSCEHVFCDPCLRQLNFRTGRRGTIRCPLCRKTVENLSPASELKNEIRNTYDTHLLRVRAKSERCAPYRRWPLPSSVGPVPRRSTSRSQRSVTLPCIFGTFLVCACVYSLLVIFLLSRMTEDLASH
ncbi:LOW QUALITY PROTEIN: E3 ubiquitin-protein ligase RNF180-like [Acropora millepora]|uniref:LOW QUALITY PROTEIN: E3 ubiquitin-protein ligase RNF180-like n=1 Tax=Acropora millepora TaxID=45264 RepID=UPI001CF3A432|nr:LOW QUALITY PROTEIN: E3 ubiquitin-protein ligase RNF180-like [Acropora millepora]